MFKHAREQYRKLRISYILREKGSDLTQSYDKAPTSTQKSNKISKKQRDNIKNATKT